jgi:heat shock protein HslJ
MLESGLVEMQMVCTMASAQVDCRSMNLKIIAVGALVLAGIGTVVVVTSGRLQLAADDPHAHDHAHDATIFIAPGGNEQIAVTFAEDHLDLTGLGYEQLLLQQIPSASGTRYENREANLTLWNNGDAVTVYRGAEVLFSGRHTSDHTHDEDHHHDTLQAPTGSQHDHDHGQAQAPTAEIATALQNKTWVWEKFQTVDGSVVSPRDVTAFSLDFGNQQQVSGQTDCNNFGGSYELTGNKLEFGALLSTKMYCEGSQEGIFLEYLQAGHLEVMVSSNELILRHEEGGGELHFTAL